MLDQRLGRWPAIETAKRQRRIYSDLKSTVYFYNLGLPRLKATQSG